MYSRGNMGSHISLSYPAPCVWAIVIKLPEVELQEVHVGGEEVYTICITNNSKTKYITY